MEPEAKKLKVDETNGKNEPSTFANLKDFEIVRILNNSDERCSIVVEGKIKGKEGKAVVQLQVSF